MTATAAAATIFVNDEPRPLIAGATVSSLAAELGFADRKGVAIAVNSGVVPRSAWLGHVLKPGDKVLVIRATQGG
jgi:sulfur carrier protein